jgi:hypothetical protein
MELFYVAVVAECVCPPSCVLQPPTLACEQCSLVVDTKYMQLPSSGRSNSHPFFRARRRSFSSSALLRAVVSSSMAVGDWKCGRAHINVEEFNFIK